MFETIQGRLWEVSRGKMKEDERKSQGQLSRNRLEHIQKRQFNDMKSCI